MAHGMKPGRPSQPRLTQTAILTEALALLGDGDHALTLRALATRLNVTPMAIQHHIGTRDTLIRALADHVHAPVTTPIEGPPHIRLRALLTAYAETTRAHPHLTLALFRIPGPLPPQAQRITDALETLLTETGLDAPAARLWRNILIDWAHGMALAQSPDDPAPALDALLAALKTG
jgi:AcrR family transcriptional regulator